MEIADSIKGASKEYKTGDTNIWWCRVEKGQKKQDWGRLYWYSVLPFHGLIFRGMIRNIAS